MSLPFWDHSETKEDRPNSIRFYCDARYECRNQHSALMTRAATHRLPHVLHS